MCSRWGVYKPASYQHGLAVAKAKTVGNTFEMKILLKHIVSTISGLLLSLSLSWGDDLQILYSKAVNAYERGQYNIAFEGFKNIVKLGNPSLKHHQKRVAIAQTWVGYMFLNGIGTNKDYNQAFKWYTLSAKQGNATAQYVLGLMFDEGLGTIQDFKEAVRFYTLSAKQGNATAQNSLALKYEQGHGVLQDIVYAYMWFNISASNGLELAADNRDTLEKKMTRSQIEKAQNLAKECVKKNYKGC